MQEAVSESGSGEANVASAMRAITIRFFDVVGMSVQKDADVIEGYFVNSRH